MLDALMPKQAQVAAYLNLDQVGQQAFAQLLSDMSTHNHELLGVI